MKNKVLNLLANKQLSPTEKYNEAFDLYRMAIGGRSVLLFQYNRGYSPQNLKNLLYDLKKVLKITDLEVNRFIPTEPQTIEEQTNKTPPVLLEELEQKAKQQELLQKQESEQKQAESQKLRDAFPFLNDEDCPDVFKILVSDKITLWYNLKAVRAELEAHQNGTALLDEAKEKELTILAVELFEAEQAINDELVNYQEKKEILGKHVKFKELAIERDLDEKTPQELHKILSNSPSYFTKNKQKLAKETDEQKREVILERIKDRELLVKLVNKKLGLA